MFPGTRSHESQLVHAEIKVDTCYEKGGLGYLSTHTILTDAIVTLMYVIKAKMFPFTALY